MHARADASAHLPHDLLLQGPGLSLEVALGGREDGRQLLVHDPGDDLAYRGRAQNLLGLTLKLGLRHSHSHHCGHAGEDVVLLDAPISTGDLQGARIGFDLLTQNLGDGLLETGQVSAAHGRGDDVDEGALGRVVADAPAQGDIDDAGARHFHGTQVTTAPVELLNGLGVGALSGQTEGVGHGAVGGQEIDEVRGAALGAEDLGALGGVLSQDCGLQQVSRGLGGALRRGTHRQVIGGLRARRRRVLGARGLLGTALVSQGQGQSGHEEARLAQAGAQRRSIVLGRRWKDLRISPVAHASSGDAALDLADHAQLGSLGVLLEGRGEARPARRIGEDPGYAATETHGVGLAPAVHLDVHAGAQRVDDARAHAVEASGRAVGPSPELPTGMELGVDELHAGQPGGGLDVNGHAASGVPHLNGTVGMDNNINAVPMAFQRLIDAVVHDLPDAVHQPPLVGRADVHAGTLAHRLQPLQYREVASGVVAAGGLVLRRGHGRTVTDHGRTGVPPRRDRTCGLRQPPPASAGSGTRTTSRSSSRGPEVLTVLSGYPERAPVQAEPG